MHFWLPWLVVQSVLLRLSSPLLCLVRFLCGWCCCSSHQHWSSYNKWWKHPSCTSSSPWPHTIQLSIQSSYIRPCLWHDQNPKPENVLSSTLRSGVADYVIFVTTLYDINFWWWSYNIDQNVSVKHEPFLKIVVSATPDLHVMELSHPLPIMLGKVPVSPLLAP
jgi:hypothetical protein